tara:strand:- start:912 stop:1118 length:207 start_codon:yes stop_codon:yes gene_type:complete
MKKLFKKNSITYASSKPIRTIPSTSKSSSPAPSSGQDINPILQDGKVIGFHYTCKCGEKTEFSFQLDS